MVLSEKRASIRSSYLRYDVLDTNQVLQNGKSVEEIGNTMVAQLGKVLSHTVVYYGLEEEHLNDPVIYNANGEKDESHHTRLITENEHAVAEWVFKNNKRAGATTGTLSEAACYYLAVRSLDAVYGVVGIEIGNGEILDAFESNMLMVILSESATVMEREVFFEVILDEDCYDYWYEYCAEAVGEEEAEATVEMLQGFISSDLYGEEAVEAYADADSFSFDCWYINDAKSFTFNYNDGEMTAEIKKTDGTVETHSYEYLGVYQIGSDETMVWGGEEFCLVFDCRKSSYEIYGMYVTIDQRVFSVHQNGKLNIGKAAIESMEKDRFIDNITEQIKEA